MNYDLTPEQLELREKVRAFADTVVAPAAYQYDTERRLPMEIIAQMGEMGLFGLPFPTEYGGQGKTYVELCIAIEALARVDQSIAVTLEAGVGLGIAPIARYGTEEQKKRWLPDLLAGRALAGFGLTEANAGSDAAGTETTAVLDGDEWVINGTKQFITNSGTPITSVVVITAVTGEKKGKDGNLKKELTSFLVPTDTPGFTAEESYDKVGWHTSDTHPLTLVDVRIPASNMLGERGRGYANFLQVLDEGRVAFAALCAGRGPGLLRGGAALRQAARRVRQADRREPVRRVQDRQDAGSRSHRSPDVPGCGAQDGGRHPFQDGGIHRQDGHERSRHGQRPRRDAGLGRIRVHERERGRAALP